LKKWREWPRGKQPTIKGNDLTVTNHVEEPFFPFLAPWGVLDDNGEEITEEVSCDNMCLGESLTFLLT
jgi:hypothetical protein